MEAGRPEDDGSRCEALAARGFTAMAVEYRSISEAPWPAQLQDVKAAVRWTHDNAAELEGLSIVRLGASPIESAPAAIALVVPVPGKREKQHRQRDRAAIASNANTRIKGFKPVTRPNPAPVQPFSHTHIFMVNRWISDQMKE
jgi:hypothetical protein